jgi:hypothetical protein
MILLVTSADIHTVVQWLPAGADAPAACQEAERARADGLGVFAICDGRVVADARGWWPGEGPDAALGGGQ